MALEALNKAGLFTPAVTTSGDGWEVVGGTQSLIHIQLAPNQTIQVQPGCMIYMSDSLKASVKLANLGRIITQGDLVKMKYTNTKGNGFIACAANIPATIIPFNLDAMHGTIMSKHETFVAAMDEHARISASFISAKSVAACCCAGIPMIMEQITGSGWVFLAAHGTIMQKNLGPNETLIVDSNSIVCMSHTVTVDVKTSGTCGAICCGGEALFNTVLCGPGLIVMQSMSIDKLRALFPRPSGGGGGDGGDGGGGGGI